MDYEWQGYFCLGSWYKLLKEKWTLEYITLNYISLSPLQLFCLYLMSPVFTENINPSVFTEASLSLDKDIQLDDWFTVNLGSTVCYDIVLNSIWSYHSDTRSLTYPPSLG